MVLAAASVALAAGATGLLAAGGDASAGLYGAAVTAVTALGLAVRRARRFVAVGLGVFSVLGALSIGLLFAPAAVAMVAAVLLGDD